MAKTTKTTATEKSKTKNKVLTQKKRATIIAIWVIGGLLVFNLLTGVISYGAMTVWCTRLPVTASDFAAGYHYSKPGQTSYGPSPFAKYYCTEQAAQKAGFNPAPW